MADSCKENKKNIQLVWLLSVSSWGLAHITPNENTPPVVHKWTSQCHSFTGQCGWENLARTTSVTQEVYSSSPWFSRAVSVFAAEMARWHEESVRRGVLCHCHADSCRQQHSQETFIVQTSWRCRRLNGDIHPIGLFGIRTDMKKGFGSNFTEVSICIPLNSPLAS